MQRTNLDREEPDLSHRVFLVQKIVSQVEGSSSVPYRPGYEWTEEGKHLDWRSLRKSARMGKWLVSHRSKMMVSWIFSHLLFSLINRRRSSEMSEEFMTHEPIASDIPPCLIMPAVVVRGRKPMLLSQGVQLIWYFLIF